MQKIFVFGYVGDGVVEVDLEIVLNDWSFCIEHARETGAELVFKADGVRRVRA